MMPANPNQQEQLKEIVFPERGIDVRSEFDEQPEGTTPSGINVRLNEPATNRDRGAQRGGLTKYNPEQVADAPIQELTSIVTCSGLGLGWSIGGVDMGDTGQNFGGIGAIDGDNFPNGGGGGYQPSISFHLTHGPFVAYVMSIEVLGPINNPLHETMSVRLDLTLNDVQNVTFFYFVPSNSSIQPGEWYTTDPNTPFNSIYFDTSEAATDAGKFGIGSTAITEGANSITYETTVPSGNSIGEFLSRVSIFRARGVYDKIAGHVVWHASFIAVKVIPFDSPGSSGVFNYTI